jgi:hypothetical protein
MLIVQKTVQLLSQKKHKNIKTLFVHIRILGAFQYSRKAPINFVVSVRLFVCPSIRMYQRCSQLTDFREILHRGLSQADVNKLQAWLKSDQKNVTSQKT